MIRVLLVLIPIVLFIGVPLAASITAESRSAPEQGNSLEGGFVVYRDWQVENPFAAGVLKGLTLMMFPRHFLGEGWRLGDKEDPYAVSGLVHQHMTNMSIVPYRTGMVAGLAFWLSIYLAMVCRHLNKLKPVAEHSARLVHR